MLMEPDFPSRPDGRGAPCAYASLQSSARSRDPPHQASAQARATGALACCLGLLLASCLDSPQKPATFLATIIRIEQPEGEFFSPRMEGPSRPLTKIYLRLDGGGTGTDKITVVAVLGPYEPALLGRPGDVVSLTYSGPIQPGEEIPFEDLSAYTVIASAPRPHA
jgi:hypothetical protein